MTRTLLAIDTSTEACSVALCAGGRTYSRYVVAPRKHGDLALPMVKDVLDEAGVTLAQLDGLGFARGPGAFTGLRIAAGLVQGMAFGLGLSVVPVSTLAAMAHRCWREYGHARIDCTIDARMGEVYFGAYQIEGEGRARLLGDERVSAATPGLLLTPADAAAGTGCPLFGDTVLAPVCYPDLFPHAIDVLALVASGFDDGLAVTAVDARPVYLRDDVVQVRPAVRL